MNLVSVRGRDFLVLEKIICHVKLSRLEIFAESILVTAHGEIILFGKDFFLFLGIFLVDYLVLNSTTSMSFMTCCKPTF